jgi:D-alanine--D-alanine ligase
MALSKPHVVVFFGGTSGNQDLSRESALWFAEYVPRSKYQVTPIEIMGDGTWKVPLGSLPTSGSVTNMMSGLSAAVRALSPAEGLQRLLSRPVQAFMSLVRGKGGDDGATHSLGQTIHVPVVGSPLATAQQTSNKHVFHQVISHITATPHTRLVQAHVPEEEVLQDMADFDQASFFIKPIHHEGSHGIELVTPGTDVAAAVRRARSFGDVIVQEHRPGQELSITIVDGHHGPLVLPTTIILPQKAAFYDDMAKRRLGRVKLHTPNVPGNTVIAEAEDIAREVYQELGCKGMATIDMIAGDDGIDVLEVNTVPTFTQFTPVIHQMKTAGLHPSHLFDAMLKEALENG